MLFIINLKVKLSLLLMKYLYMKNFILLLVLISFYSCSSNEIIEEIPDATLIGRWNLKGFEGNILYEFTENKRFTLYSGDGVFESVEDLVASGRNCNDWWFEADKITIDLNFGNMVTRTPKFKCSNNVIDWLNENEEVVETYFRENYVLSACNEE